MTENKTRYLTFMGNVNTKIEVTKDEFETTVGCYEIDLRNYRGKTQVEYVLPHKYPMNTFLNKKPHRKWKNKNVVDFIRSLSRMCVFLIDFRQATIIE